MNHGLLPLPKDDRDFALGAYIDLPDPSTLPEHFVLPTLGVKDQKGTDFCTAFSLCTLSEIQEGVELEPSWSFAMTKDLEGDHTTYGADLRTACKSHVKYGALEAKDSPYSVKNTNPDLLRNPEFWDVSLMDKAAVHKKKTYFKVGGPYDAFDTIRSSIYHYRDKGQGVALGVVWGWSNEQMFIDEPAEQGGGHAIACIGWDKEYLVIQNSYGLKAGKHGYVYLSRKVINANVEKFGAFMLTDIPREQVEVVLTGEDELQALFAKFLDLLKALLAKIKHG